MNLLQKIISYGKKLAGLRYGETLKPARDWFVLLALVLAGLVASVAWNAWFFFGVVERDLSSSVPDESKEALDRSALEAARGALQAQEQEESKYRSEYRFVDPSR